MADKNGTPQQQRNACFPTTPAKATGGCPLNGPDVAIIPMRYALDRSRYDENPKKLKPLLKTGKWAALPALKTRSYTLRQLYTGYVYVYDETSKALHEYEYAANTGLLTRIKWTEADTGKDKRSGAGESKNHLVYPRKNQLHIAYAPKQWTWRICEHMRSNPGSRKEWMKALDLPSYCITQAARDTLPLSSLADAVADVDKGAVVSDERFADSAIPAMAPARESIGEAIFSPLAADVFWTGSVPDKDSALVIAIDAPIEVLKDLGMQLAGDQAAYQSWQKEHQHKIQIAQTVEALCGATLAPDKLPSSISNDAAKTRQYQRDLDAYYTQRESEEDQAIADSLGGSPAIITLPDRFKAVEMEKSIKTKYNVKMLESDYQTWKSRGKWRKEIDLDGAHAYVQSHQKDGVILLKRVYDTQDDFECWSKHIGTEPLRLFIDTTNRAHLLYLQETMVSLLQIYCQNSRSSAWLAEEDVKGTTLFGAVRYGFSKELKVAFGEPSEKLLNGLGDYTNLATRIGEINAAINHEGFTSQPWMRALKQSTQDTFKNLKDLASKEGKETAEAILLVLIPSDSRLAMGKKQNITVLLRNMLIGQILSNTSDRIAIDKDIAKKLRLWKNEWLVLNKKISELKRQWLYPGRNGTRKDIATTLLTQEKTLKAHELKIPGILDFQNNRYAELMRDEIHKFSQSGADVAKDWTAKAKSWSQRWGVNSASITWGVIVINFVNTALTYKDLTKDGDYSGKDMIKVVYGMSYSFNLLMAVFLETPWAVAKNVKPVLIDGKEVSILSRSAGFWVEKGNLAWADTVRGFSRAMIAMGAFAVIATVLELWDIQDDYAGARTTSEKAALWVKGIAVFGMGAAGVAQILATTIMRSWAVIIMGPWVAFSIMMLGTIYLLATMAVNYFKHDGVGWWLRRCCWSLTKTDRFPDNELGRAEATRSLLEIQLSPQAYVKSTTTQKSVYMYNRPGRIINVQNGAWIQLRLPNAVRGQFVEFNIINSKSPLYILPVSRIDDSVQVPFLDNGQFTPANEFEIATNQAKAQRTASTNIPEMPAKGEDIVWQTWVPLSENADYIELQVWYPSDLLKPGSEDTGYLYQLELDTSGKTQVDGLTVTELQVKQSSRAKASLLVVAE
ncbi:toxin VasX [Pseudomonas frederiksbergensis]|uniref:toxin VasX n=1 Tax=Pseudomonas frederiksbergensis TaxID=104087 RepID=UPI003D24192A